MTTGKISNWISEPKLTLLCEIFDSLPDEHNTGEFRAFTNGISKQHQFYNFVSDLLLDDLCQVTNTNLSITVAMLLKESIPWSVHTDYQKGDQHPGMAFLIPISWNGPDQSFTHTVVFNEESTESFNTFLNRNQKKTPNAVYLHNSLCGHVPKESLEYVSLRAAYRWEPGDLIFWDRKLLHCSDNFLDQRITEKKAIVIFTENLPAR
jgi:hypothetical protein